MHKSLSLGDESTLLRHAAGKILVKVLLRINTSANENANPASLSSIQGYDCGAKIAMENFHV